MTKCRVVVTEVISLHPYREIKRNCRLKTTHGDLCTRHWNEEQARAEAEQRAKQAELESQERSAENERLRATRGAKPLDPQAPSHYFDGPPCRCGHNRGDHAFHLCNHMFANHSECEYDECDHCGCRDYVEARADPTGSI